MSFVDILQRAEVLGNNHVDQKVKRLLFDQFYVFRLNLHLHPA